jgi:hypothetical protein
MAALIHLQTGSHISLDFTAFFPQQPNFSSKLAGNFCHEMATLIHLQAGK